MTLAWNASPSLTVIGYRVYYGAETGVYTNILDIGNVTSAKISGLVAGVTYYFAVTAYDIFGVESGFSNEIRYAPPPPPPPPRLLLNVDPTGEMVVGVAGVAGHSYKVLASQNLVDWVVLGSVTVDASGVISFTDPEARNYPARFYRTVETQPQSGWSFSY